MADEKPRNFTDARLEDIEKYFKKYFNEMNVIDKLFYHVGIFNINTEYNNKQFVRSLGKTAGTVNAKISEIFKGVKLIEKNYKSKLKTSRNQIDSYNKIINEFNSAITFNNFSTEYNFTTLENNIVDDYLKTIEVKVDAILNKDINDITDDDLEILAYSYINTSDDDTRQKIINYFSHDVTDEHVTDESILNEYDIHYYAMDEKFETFQKCCYVYYCQSYEDYLNGDCSEYDFNTAWKNWYIMSNIDSEKYYLADKDNNPFVIENGHFCYKVAKYNTIYIDEFGGLYEHKNDRNKIFNGSQLYYEIDNDVNFVFYEPGASSQSHMEGIVINKNYSDSQVDWIQKGIDKSIGSIGKAIPGAGGKAIKIAAKIAKTAVEIDKTKDSEFNDFSNSNIVGWFKLKVIDSGDGTYHIMASPETKQEFEKFINAVKRYSRLEEKYKDLTYDNFIKGEFNASAIYSDIRNNDELRTELGWS